MQPFLQSLSFHHRSHFCTLRKDSSNLYIWRDVEEGSQCKCRFTSNVSRQAREELGTHGVVVAVLIIRLVTKFRYAHVTCTKSYSRTSSCSKHVVCRLRHWFHKTPVFRFRHPLSRVNPTSAPEWSPWRLARWVHNSFSIIATSVILICSTQLPYMKACPSDALFSRSRPIGCLTLSMRQC